MSDTMVRHVITLLGTRREHWRMMTKIEEQFMTQAAMMEENERSVLPPVQLTRFFVDNDAPVQLIQFGNRLCMVSGSDLKFSRPVVMWLASLCKNRREVTMWAYTLVRSTWSNDGQPIMMEKMMRLLDRKVPGPLSYQTVWESQIVDNNQNLLDRSITYQK